MNEGNVRVNGKQVEVSFEKNPANIDWGNTLIVLECSGAFRTRETLEQHIHQNVKKVLVSAPCDDSIKHIVMGVNEQKITKYDRIISNASCTTKSIVLPLKVLMDLGLEDVKVYFATVHAATNTQKAPYSIDNIILHSTGASKSIQKVLPRVVSVHGKAYRVPVADGSWTDMTIIAKSDGYISEQDVKEAIYRASGNTRLGLVHKEYPGLEDIINKEKRHYTAQVVQPLIKVNSEFLEEGEGAGEEALGYYLLTINMVVGYDNEAGSAYDLVDMASYISFKQLL